MNPTDFKKYLAELIGTAAITATVLGAGFMAQGLGVDAWGGLLLNGLATAAILFVAITVLAPISGAHFNPAVTLAFTLRKQIGIATGLAYLSAQVLGGLLGAALANLMYSGEIFAASSVERGGIGFGIAEFIASFGLVLVVLLLSDQGRGQFIAASVALWIFAGYFFTASSAFANPAVTLARVFSEAPSSIALSSALVFIAFQFAGGIFAVAVARAFNNKTEGH